MVFMKQKHEQPSGQSRETAEEKNYKELKRSAQEKENIMKKTLTNTT